MFLKKIMSIHFKIAERSKKNVPLKAKGVSFFVEWVVCVFTCAKWRICTFPQENVPQS